MRARLDVPSAQVGLGSTDEQQRMVEVELEMLKYCTALANQRLNALRPMGRLPGEVLAMIFSYTQTPPDEHRDGWIPSRRLVEVDIPAEKQSSGEKKNYKKSTVVRFDLGFIWVTHVCSAWRTVRARARHVQSTLMAYSIYNRQHCTTKVYGGL